MPLHDDAVARRSRSGRHARKKGLAGTLSWLWAGWRVEILLVLAFALGAFLLLERMQLRMTLVGWLQGGIQATKQVASGAVRALVDLAHNSTLSDVVGLALIGAVLFLVAWRARWRLLNSPSLTARECPRCHGGLHRIHRHDLDRLISVYVPVRRYSCQNRDCGWQGLRVGRSPFD